MAQPIIILKFFKKTNMKKIFNISLALVFAIFFYDCSRGFDTEKKQNNRNNIVDVSILIKKIRIDEPIIGSVARLYLNDKYLIIGDYKSQNNQILIFNKNNYKYLASTAPKGVGPGEIANMGYITIDDKKELFYVSDHGKQKIFTYCFDSIFKNPKFMPVAKYEMKNGLFPSKYYFINDTLCMSLVIEPTGNSGYNQSLAKWNMRTGEFSVMEYKHPKIKKKRINFCISKKYDRYVECYLYHDLITICNLDGSLICNIYGKDWDNKRTNQIQYFDNVFFCGDKIVASFSGNENSINEHFPTKFIVFDLNGNYIKTLDTKLKITDSCYDSENNRILLSLDDMMQFAYLELDGVM